MKNISDMYLVCFLFVVTILIWFLEREYVLFVKKNYMVLH
ncbi:putative membrane protein [Clostridioides difficile CD38]|nr:putative membrane protein [Clostridioides difficile CD38]